MEGKMEQDVLRKLKRRRHQRLWQKVVSMMMCVVVFCTTYALILPAITKEADTFCGLEEHTHSIACYRQQGELICEFAQMELHVHTEDCNPTTEEMPSCGLEEAEAHTHTDACTPVEEKTLCCTLEEGPGHTHSEACVSLTEKALVCGNEETQGHTHTDACSVLETVLTCALTETEEHTHGEGCYTEVASNVCGLEEVSAHTHTDACYTAATAEYICGQEEAEAHTHTDECYQITTTYGCGLEEMEAHVHKEACYPAVYDCEQEAADHIHTEECYASAPELICTLEENDEHTHGADCYIGTMSCEQEEHVHTLECYSDPDADLEDASYWESMLPGLTGNLAEDLVAVAESQLGYTESTRNYIVEGVDDIKGYTRYGAWYGIPYDDWSAMFVSFCLHYANANGMPLESSCSNWVYQLQSAGMYAAAADHTPKAGDLVFFDWNGDGGADHVGIVSRYFPEENGAARLQCIEGDRKNTVCETEYNQTDPDILGYGVLPEPQPPVTEAPEEETQPEERIGPEDTDAWAVLVDPADQPVEETVSPFSLRKMSISTWAMPRASEPLDLTKYIQSVTMYDMEGNILPSGSSVTEGDMIEFRIDYVINGQTLAVMNGQNLSVISNTLTYTIPNTFQVIKDNSGIIRDASMQEVGTFTISSNQLSLTFYDEFVRNNANGLAINGKVSFYSTVVKITDEDNEEQNYKFTDEITLGVIIEEKNEVVGSVEIEKQKISVDGDELVYEVKVFSEEGTTGPVIITDRMSPGLTFVKGISVQKGNTPVPNAEFVPAADKSSFTMTLPEMAAGDIYTVKYRCKADIHLLGADMTARNTASVAAKDSQNNDLEDEITVEHTFQVLEKTGVQNEDGTITWSITVNRDKLDISGWVLEDILNGTGEDAAYKGKVTILDLDGNVLAEDVTLPYTFPEGSNDTYVITYTSSHTLAEGATIYNKAILKDSDTEVTVVTGVGIGTPIEKVGQGGEPMQDAEGNYILPTTWTVTVDTTGGSIPAGSYFYDEMLGYPSNDMYMTYDQLMAALANIEAELNRVTGQGASKFEATVLEPSYDSGPTYNRAQLAANVNNCQSMKFEGFCVWLSAEVPKGNILTFTYDACGVFPNNVLASTTYVNRININGEHEVQGRVDYLEGTIQATKHAIKYVDPASLDNFQWHWSGMDWNGENGVTSLEYEKLHNGYLAWAVGVSVPPAYTDGGDITIKENLPEGLTVKGIKIVFMSSVPSNGLMVRNMEPGKTVESTVTIYPAELYGTWRPQGAKDLVFKTTLTESGDLELKVPGEFFRNMSDYIAHQNLTAVPKLTEWYFHLYIYTQINEDFAWTPTAEDSLVYVNSFENNVQIFNENGTRIDNDYQTQKITKNEKDNMVRKDVDVEDGVLSYSVLLNKYGKDLVPNSSILQIRDELTYTSSAARHLRLRLIPGTVKLFEAVKNADGTYGKGSQIERAYRYNESSTEDNGVTSWTHILEMDVPDGKAMILEYSYGASGDKDAVHEVNNVCSIEGIGEGNLEGDSKVELEVKDSGAEANVDGVLIYKVDANNNGLFLEKAQFNIYIWNQDAQDYILVHHHDNSNSIFTTNQQGVISLDRNAINEDQFAYNTAYYIVEIESPEGYYLSPEPYYFYIINNDTVNNPYCMPANFQGKGLQNGDIIYRENVSDKTEITVEKYWQDYSGESITVTGETVKSVTLELWQMLQGDPGSAKRYGTYTMTPDANGNWNLTITGLPKATANVDGTKGTNYLYYIKEVGVNGFDLESAENNDGINSGTIKLVNRKQEGYVLPKTGGAGTNLYTMAGLLLMLTSAAYLMYSNHPRRREEI